MILAGVLVGLIIAGIGGYLIGSNTASSPKPGGQTASVSQGSASVPPSGGGGSLAPYEASRLALNQGKFDANLMPLAESWLPWMSGCLRAGEPGGPKPEVGEIQRVACQIGSFDLVFGQFKSLADYNTAFRGRQRKNIDAQALAPGVAPVAKKSGMSGKSSGEYVEFAYRQPDGAPAAGIWWTNAGSLTAAYLVASWNDELGGSWEPLRDLWKRYS